MTEAEIEDIWQWLWSRFGNALADSPLIDRETVRENAHILAPIRAAHKQCEVGCIAGRGCDGRRFTLDISASKFYGRYMPATEECPKFPRPITSVASNLPEFGFSQRILDRMTARLTKPVRLSSFPSFVHIPEEAETSGLTNTEVPSPKPGNMTNPYEISDASTRNMTISEFLSSANAAGLTRDVLIQGGLVFPPVPIQVKSQEVSTPRADHTPSGQGSMYSYRVQSRMVYPEGSEKATTTESEGAPHTREGLPIEISTGQPTSTLRFESLNFSALGHWLGVAMAMHGIVPGFLDVTTLAVPGDEYENSPLGRFLNYVNEVSALVLMQYRELQPGRSSTAYVLGALNRFIADGGTLWVVIDVPWNQVGVRSTLEIPVLEEILTLPKYELVIQ